MLIPEKRAEFAKELMNTLDNKLDPVFVELIMQTRGHSCYDKHKQGMLGVVPDTVKNIHQFIDYLDKRWGSFPDGIVDGLKREGNVLTRRISKCHCEYVNASKDPIPKNYCNCSAGFYQSMFEEYIKKPVNVEIVTSIVSGGEKCEIKITLPPNLFEK
ncbi:MAG: hypothetical protein EU530_00275 [Promethearchaeota archaeon]|nr:MAG: hypothetical protein EU530_00275 [Candidatus Lokiarchaeota archaeon]